MIEQKSGTKAKADKKESTNLLQNNSESTDNHLFFHRQSAQLVIRIDCMIHSTLSLLFDCWHECHGNVGPHSILNRQPLPLMFSLHRLCTHSQSSASPSSSWIKFPPTANVHWSHVVVRVGKSILLRPQFYNLSPTNRTYHACWL